MPIGRIGGASEVGFGLTTSGAAPGLERCPALAGLNPTAGGDCAEPAGTAPGARLPGGTAGPSPGSVVGFGGGDVRMGGGGSVSNAAPVPPSVERRAEGVDGSVSCSFVVIALPLWGPIVTFTADRAHSTSRREAA
jgi:hypothetical protein